MPSDGCAAGVAGLRMVRAVFWGLHSPQTVGGLCARPTSWRFCSSSPTPEPENSHISDTSTQGASQGSSEAASVAAEDSN